MPACPTGERAGGGRAEGGERRRLAPCRSVTFSATDGAAVTPGGLAPRGPGGGRGAAPQDTAVPPERGRFKNKTHRGNVGGYSHGTQQRAQAALPKHKHRLWYLKAAETLAGKLGGFWHEMEERGRGFGSALRGGRWRTISYQTNPLHGPIRVALQNMPLSKIKFKKKKKRKTVQNVPSSSDTVAFLHFAACTHAAWLGPVGWLVPLKWLVSVCDAPQFSVE